MNINDLIANNMKKTTIMAFCAAFTIMLAACSSNEPKNGNDIITGEALTEWDGVGVPQWLNDQMFKIAVAEHGCGLSSLLYLGHTAYDAYKFYYNEKPHIAINYKVDAGEVFYDGSHQPMTPLEWGMVYLTNDGRRIVSADVEKAYKAESKIIYSRKLAQKVPAEIILPDGSNASWMVKEIEDSYKKYDANKVLECIGVKFDSKANTVILFEMSMTSSESKTTARFFATDGSELKDKALEGSYKIIAENGDKDLWINFEYTGVTY
mgnify:FL=1